MTKNCALFGRKFFISRRQLITHLGTIVNTLKEYLEEGTTVFVTHFVLMTERRKYISSLLQSTEKV